jgi:pimeloyl-ACP methyl ester carboxylesterase
MQLGAVMKTLGRLVLLVLVLALVFGITLYEQPLWVQRQDVHLGLFLHRVQSNYVMTPEGRVHYYEAEPRFAPEHGIPIVLVHGLGDRAESWAPMLERLKKAGFHVYAPDLLGYGRSPKPGDSDYSIATQEKFVADFIQALGLPKTDVGGWSMGGGIALKLALDHPEMVDRVVVYNNVGIRFNLTYSPAELFHPHDGVEVQRLFSMMEPTAPPLPNFVRKDILSHMDANQWVVDRGVESMLTYKDAVDGQLSGIKEPLLIVWGDKDGLIPLEVGQKMHAMVPGSELDVIEGCGHLAPATCPVQVAAATATFLTADPAPAGGMRTLVRTK